LAHFNIVHLYPDLMNLYGDRGNLICIKRRIEWLGHDCTIKTVRLHEEVDFGNTDMLFMGGGSDREQVLVYRDLLTRADRIRELIEDGLPVLCICGAYQLLGKSYRAIDGTELDGLGFFNFHTTGEQTRLIGNILIECRLENTLVEVVGFENHGGRTFLDDSSVEPLGRVIKGSGNNGIDGTEGIKYKNLIGTYLHGPLLPKNPTLTDWFIKNMADRRNTMLTKQLDNKIENFAHEQVKNRLLNKRS
jgi:CobQ-like glutamine amidotransferase family enzyme